MYAFLIPTYVHQVSNNYKRFKHWFQEDDDEVRIVPEKSAVVSIILMVQRVLYKVVLANIFCRITFMYNTLLLLST